LGSLCKFFFFASAVHQTVFLFMSTLPFAVGEFEAAVSTWLVIGACSYGRTRVAQQPHAAFAHHMSCT
jgi:hypothetical protein